MLYDIITTNESKQNDEILNKEGKEFNNINENEMENILYKEFVCFIIYI